MERSLHRVAAAALSHTFFYSIHAAVQSKDKKAAKDMDTAVIHALKSHKTWMDILSHLENKLDGSDTNCNAHFASTQASLRSPLAEEDEIGSKSFSETPQSSELAGEADDPPDLPSVS